MITKEQIQTMLTNHLKSLDDDNLIKAIVEYALRGFSDKEDYNDWEQLRFIKQKMDKVWTSVKSVTEKEVVKEKIIRMLKAFPTPKELKEKGNKH